MANLHVRGLMQPPPGAENLEGEELTIPSCTCCGNETGDWCEGAGCSLLSVANPVCNRCEMMHRVCRDCEAKGFDRAACSEEFHAEAIRGSHAVCAYCLFETGIIKRCSLCHRAHCCNRKCQKLDWRLRHKEECRPNQEGQQNRNSGGSENRSWMRML